MNEPDDDFLALLARVCRDDGEALAALIALYEPAIRRAARTLLGRALRSSIDPTDLVQSVHLEMILGLRMRKLAVDSPGHLRSLAMTLLRHNYIEHWRRHRRQVRHQAALALTDRPARGSHSKSRHEIDPARRCRIQ